MVVFRVGMWSYSDHTKAKKSVIYFTSNTHTLLHIASLGADTLAYHLLLH